jgi:hypothetical protein
MGFERVLDEELPSRVVRVQRSFHRLALSGSRVSDGLNALIAAAPMLSSSSVTGPYAFSWREEAGLIHVTPIRGQHTFLDTVVPSFQVNQKSLPFALRQLHRILDPGYPEPGPTGGNSGNLLTARQGPGSPPRKSYDELQQELARPVSIALTNVTVRQILDALVLSHGGASWVVRYASGAASYPGCQIEVVTFDNLREPTHARIR